MCFIIYSLSLPVSLFFKKNASHFKLVQLGRRSHMMLPLSPTQKTGLEVQGVSRRYWESVGVFCYCRLLPVGTNGTAQGDSIKVLVSLVPWFS